MNPQLPSRSSPGDRFLHAAKVRRFFKALEEVPRSPRFDLDNPRALGEWDIVIVGSDEVWNLSHPWYGGRAAFYGRGINSDRLVSYAASFGNQRATDGLPPFWVDALSNFAMISVRDANSASIIRDALGREPETVLDPCLQFPRPALLPNLISGEHPYVAVYGHGFPGWFCAAVRSWAVGQGYRLLSTGYRNNWADEQFIDAGPQAFARLIAEAKAVVTNFFHGCVFALLNKKPFACVTSDYRANKLAGLIQLLSAERHLWVETQEPSLRECVLETPVDPRILRRIDLLRLRSQRYIEEAVAI